MISKALEDELKTLRTLDGLPYRLLRLPMPHPIYDDGDRLPATYANFVILNGAVIMPTYRQPANDQAAKTVLSQNFPRQGNRMYRRLYRSQTTRIAPLSDHAISSHRITNNKLYDSQNSTYTAT